MTALTSQQMRELADICSDCGGTLGQCNAARVACCPDCQHFKPDVSAFRAAADPSDSPDSPRRKLSSLWAQGYRTGEAYRD